MLRHIAFKFRIYPNTEQMILLQKTFGCVRFVYNYYLSMRKELYDTEKRSMSYNDCAKDLVSLKKEKQFLREVDSIALQQSLRHLENAFQNFFRNTNTGYPGFKSKKHHHHSYSTMCVNHNIRLEEGRLLLPKLKWVKIKKHREIPEDYQLKSVTVSMTPTGKCYASLLYEYEAEIRPAARTGKAIGLDFSMESLFVSSEEEIGTEGGFLHRYRKAQERLSRAQRRLSKCKKGSKRYQKQKRRVALLHEKTADQRRDYLHKKSRQIVNAYDIVCVEDLDMQGMSKALHFGKAVHDNGWGMFRSFLEYKLKESGKELVKIDRWYPSSKQCHVWGYKKSDLKLSERRWKCPKCGTEHDRDYNASINIKKEGIRLLSA